jgi:sec-independent protein translocase protein TatA
MGAGLFSPTHLLILGALSLLLFGSKRLPEVGRSLGSGMREFKTSVTGMDTGLESLHDVGTPAVPEPVAGQDEPPNPEG